MRTDWKTLEESSKLKRQADSRSNFGQVLQDDDLVQCKLKEVLSTFFILDTLESSPVRNVLRCRALRSVHSLRVCPLECQRSGTACHHLCDCTPCFFLAVQKQNMFEYDASFFAGFRVTKVMLLCISCYVSLFLTWASCIRHCRDPWSWQTSSSGLRARSCFLTVALWHC